MIPITVTDVGIVTDANLLLHINADSPIVVIDDGISIDTRELQFAKDADGRWVSDVGITICVITAD